MMNKKLSLPPGPPERPVLGSLVRFGKKPLRFLQSLVAYGDITSFHLLHVPCYLLNRPDYVKQVLQEKYSNYSKGTLDFKVFRNVFGNGLFTSEGSLWLQQRRLMQPAFHRKQIMQFGERMTHAVEATTTAWQQRYVSAEETLDVWEEMRRLSIRIAGESLFSVDPSHVAIGQHFEALEQYIIDLFQFPLVLPRWIPTPPNRRLVKAHSALYAMINTMIAERRHEHRESNDLLTMLIQAQDEDGSVMTHAQIRDEITTLLFAGHETTAATLTWVWYMLAKYPDVEQQLHDELDTVLGGRIPTVEDIPHLLYTKMVIDETLRLWPPAFMTNRQAVNDDVIGGYPIRKKSIVFVSPFTMQRHPEFWNDPIHFDPTRFTPERIAQRPRFAYFPFGGGPHLCIGNTFALTEILLTVATIAGRYRLRLVDGHKVEPALLPTLRPRNLFMTLHARV